MSTSPDGSSDDPAAANTSPSVESALPVAALSSAPKRSKSRWYVGLGVSALVVVATLWRAREVIELVESPARDFATRAALPRPASEFGVVVVRITEQDYATMFRGDSPLDAETIRQLVADIAAGQPAAIGVDLDTSDPRQRIVLTDTSIPVVWARGALPCNRELLTAQERLSCARTDAGEANATDSANRGDAKPKSHEIFAALPVLGGAPKVRAGLVAFPLDAHGVLRRYVRALRTTEGQIMTLPIALLCATRADTDGDSVRGRARCDHAKGSRSEHHADARAEPEQSRYIDFRPPARGTPLTLSASEVRDLARDQGTDAAREYRSGTLFKGRVVVLGGQYRAARDEYPTPLGSMAGIDVITQIIETERAGTGRVPPGTAAMTVATLAVIGVILLVFRRFTLPSALVVVAVLVGFLTPIVSRLLTGSFVIALPYLLAVVGVVLIEQLIEVANEYRNDLLYQNTDRLWREAGHAATAPGEAAEHHAPEKIDLRLLAAMLWRRLKPRPAPNESSPHPAPREGS